MNQGALLQLETDGDFTEDISLPEFTKWSKVHNRNEMIIETLAILSVRWYNSLILWRLFSFRVVVWRLWRSFVDLRQRVAVTQLYFSASSSLVLFFEFVEEDQNKITERRNKLFLLCKTWLSISSSWSSLLKFFLEVIESVLSLPSGDHISFPETQISSVAA